MGGVSVNFETPDGTGYYTVSAGYSDESSDGVITKGERQRALEALRAEIQRGSEDIRNQGLILPTDAEVTISEAKPADWCFPVFGCAVDAGSTLEHLRPEPRWINSVVALFGPTPGPPNRPDEQTMARFQSYVSHATSFIGWDGKGLYELIVNDPANQNQMGIVRADQIDQWDTSVDEIRLPEVDEGFHKAVEEELRRNTLTRGDAQLAKQYHDARDLIRKANDPAINQPSPYSQKLTGADREPRTLSLQEIDDMGKYLVKHKRWPQKDLRKNVLKLVAAYITTVNLFGVASGRFAQRIGK